MGVMRIYLRRHCQLVLIRFSFDPKEGVRYTTSYWKIENSLGAIDGYSNLIAHQP